jgi:hypothetical protein
MCYLCLEGSNNPFGVRNSSKDNMEAKKSRAKEIKRVLLSLESATVMCDKVKEEIVKLKEEQYNLAKEI